MLKVYWSLHDTQILLYIYIYIYTHTQIHTYTHNKQRVWIVTYEKVAVFIVVNWKSSCRKNLALKWTAWHTFKGNFVKVKTSINLPLPTLIYDFIQKPQLPLFCQAPPPSSLETVQAPSLLGNSPLYIGVSGTNP